MTHIRTGASPVFPLLVVHYEFLGLFYSCPCSSPPGPHIIPQPKRFESPLRTRTQSPATKAQTALNPLHVEFPENELFYRTGAELRRVEGGCFEPGVFCMKDGTEDCVATPVTGTKGNKGKKFIKLWSIYRRGLRST